MMLLMLYETQNGPSLSTLLQVKNVGLSADYLTRRNLMIDVTSSSQFTEKGEHQYKKYM